MGDSQQPKPAAPRFEVPDLELEPVAPARAVPTANGPDRSPSFGSLGSSPFDDDFVLLGPSIDLASADQPAGFGVSSSFAELEDSAESGLAIEAATTHTATRAAATRSSEREHVVQWPSGQGPAREQLAFDPLEVSLLANYGAPPKHVYATPAYAYRVFTRQRELKNRLRALEADYARAEAERASRLAELAEAVRPDTEDVAQFQGFLAPLRELERLASARGQALSSVNAELSAHAGALDAELAALTAQQTSERGRESDAQRLYDERDAAVRRAEAKLKRAQIEIRAVTQVVAQKVGPQGGQTPEPEATQLAALNERASAMQPEVEAARAELQRAKAELAAASARVGALQRNERLVGRKRQLLVKHYRQELDVRSRSMTESEQAQRTALVDLGRSVLAARGSIAVSETWLEQVRSSGARADALALGCELHLRALEAYDRARAAQGVRLAATFAALFLLLVALKLAL